MDELVELRFGWSKISHGLTVKNLDATRPFIKQSVFMSNKDDLVAYWYGCDFSLLFFILAAEIALRLTHSISVLTHLHACICSLPDFGQFKEALNKVVPDAKEVGTSLCI